MFVTGAAHGTVAAASAVAHHRFAAALFSHDADYNGGDDTDERRAYYDSPKIGCEPLEHSLNPFLFFCQLVCFLVGLEEHEQHARDQQDGDDQSDYIQRTREGAADLVDAEGYHIGEATLI